ncbi:energy transducer TonB [Rhodocaloribacter sp.]
MLAQLEIDAPEIRHETPDEPVRESPARPAERPSKDEAVRRDTPSPHVPKAHGLKPYKHPKADLRRNYRLYIEFGLIVALILLIALFRAPVRPKEEGFNIELATQEVVQMEEVTQTHQEVKPPPPPRPPVPVEVPNDVVLDDVELNLDATLDMNEALTELPPPPPPPKEEAPAVEEEAEIFVVVEEMPEIIGGTAQIYKYLEYPDIARKAGLEGLVVVQIVVEPDGRPANPVVARSAGDVLDKAAVEAVMRLRFKPGKQRGVPVRVRMAIPIRFRLRDLKRKG